MSGASAASVAAKKAAAGVKADKQGSVATKQDEIPQGEDTTRRLTKIIVAKKEATKEVTLLANEVEIHPRALSKRFSSSFSDLSRSAASDRPNYQKQPSTDSITGTKFCEEEELDDNDEEEDLPKQKGKAKLAEKSIDPTGLGQFILSADERETDSDEEEAPERNKITSIFSRRMSMTTKSSHEPFHSSPSIRRSTTSGDLVGSSPNLGHRVTRKVSLANVESVYPDRPEKNNFEFINPGSAKEHQGSSVMYTPGEEGHSNQKELEERIRPFIGTVDQNYFRERRSTRTMNAATVRKSIRAGHDGAMGISSSNSFSDLPKHSTSSSGDHTPLLMGYTPGRPSQAHMVEIPTAKLERKSLARSSTDDSKQSRRRSTMASKASRGEKKKSSLLEMLQKIAISLGFGFGASAETTASSIPPEMQKRIKELAAWLNERDPGRFPNLEQHCTKLLQNYEMELLCTAIYNRYHAVPPGWHVYLPQVARERRLSTTAENMASIKRAASITTNSSVTILEDQSSPKKERRISLFSV